MKVVAHVLVYGQERIFEVPCGLGDKTFKWLALTVSQRFANLCPNGTLRHKDDIRGATDRAQQTPYEIYLADGELPHPSCVIADFLKDGDHVFVGLLENHSVSKISGAPHFSKWSTEAFVNSIDSKVEDEGKEEEEEEDEDGDDGEEISSDKERRLIALQGRANFMRLMLHSQMINKKLIKNEVDSVWGSAIAKGMPLLKENISAPLKDVVTSNWDTLKELYRHFAPDGSMTEENFNSFCSNTNIFYSRDLQSMAHRIYRRVCNSMQLNVFDFSCFLISLILITQSRFHDMYEKLTPSLDCVNGFEELFRRCIRPWSQKEVFESYLKEEFCRDEFLGAIRNMSEDLFQIFQKYSGKARELSTTLTMDYMNEILTESKLHEDKVHGKAKRLFDHVHHGSIFGRSEASMRENNPPNEYMFPEFVEAVALAAYEKYGKSGTPVIDCYLEGLKNVVDTCNKK